MKCLIIQETIMENFKIKISEIKTNSKTQIDYVDINLVYHILDDEQFSKEQKVEYLKNFMKRLEDELSYL